MLTTWVDKILQLPVEEVLRKWEAAIRAEYKFLPGINYREIHSSWAKWFSGRLQGKTREEIKNLITKEKDSIIWSGDHIRAFSRDTRLKILHLLEKTTDVTFFWGLKKLCGMAA